MTFRFNEQEQTNGHQICNHDDHVQHMEGIVQRSQDKNHIDMIKNQVQIIATKNETKHIELSTEGEQSPAFDILSYGYPHVTSIQDPAGETLSDQGELVGRKIYTQTYKPPIWKMIISVFGALITGGVCGLLVLSFIQGNISFPNPTTSVSKLGNKSAMFKKNLTQVSDLGVQQQNELQAGKSDHHFLSVKKNDSHSLQTTSDSNVTAVHIPAKMIYMLQYGVFTQADTAHKAAIQLRELGLAAMEEEAGQYRVYAGTAKSREEAMGLSLLFKNKQLNLYVREVHRPELTKLSFNGKKVDIEQFIKQSDKVSNWLVSQSIIYLGKPAAIPFEAGIIKQLRQEHQQWTQQMITVQKGIPIHAKNEWIKLVQAMNTAISAVNEYKKQPSFAHLWTVQQAMMLYHIAEKAWISTIQA